MKIRIFTYVYLIYGIISNMPNSTLILVDDHPIFTKGLAQLLDSQPTYEILGTASTSQEAVDLVRARCPDLAIVDLNLGDQDGLELIKDLRHIHKDIKILVLSMHDERYYAERALKNGARGYVMKEDDITNVLEAVKTVLSGKIWISESERDRLFEYLSSGESLQKNNDKFTTINILSNRQLQIFKMTGKGLGTSEIASKLNLSPKTVDTHKEHIKLKLHCNTSQELRQLAIEWVNE